MQLRSSNLYVVIMIFIMFWTRRESLCISYRALLHPFGHLLHYLLYNVLLMGTEKREEACKYVSLYQFYLSACWHLFKEIRYISILETHLIENWRVSGKLKSSRENEWIELNSYYWFRKWWPDSDTIGEGLLL